MRLLYILACLAYSTLIFAQLNATLRSNFDYEEGVNDVWGYVSPDGTEYALVGLNSGVSVVSLADPDVPVEVGRTTGAESPWRDMKTYGEYAYVTADVGEDGLTVIDLSELPESISFTHERYEVPGFEELFVRAHNLYIDTVRGLAFTAGGDRDVNDGGVLIFDLKANPEQPPLIAVGPEEYAHDAYVQNDLLYASEIYEGELAIYDLSDLDSITEVGRTLTPFTFTHNAWATADGRTVFTTDEKSNASVAAFDISDLQNIRLLDEYRPLSSLNTGTIPHNVHVIDDYLSISHYTDGLRVVDASVPDNLIEIANYDTWTGADGGFSGNWGAYPFLPSGLTLVSDRSTGLYVVDVAYRRAARLTGTVTDLESGRAVNDATVALVSEQLARDASDALGRYATGLAEGGEYTLTASAVGYYDTTQQVSLSNGTTTTLDFGMRTRPAAEISFEVRDAETQELVPAALVTLASEPISYTSQSDERGVVTIGEVFDYDYTVSVTAWGYLPLEVSINGTDFGGRTITLEPGYEDSFTTDLGWDVSGTALRGDWGRGVPALSRASGIATQPGGDTPADTGEIAYFTGNQAGNPTAHDVDRGTAILTSPLMDLSDYGDSAVLSYQYWFANFNGENAPNDSMAVALSDGRDTVVLATYFGITERWTGDTFLVADVLPLSDSMYLIVSTSDDGLQDDIVEAGFDYFRVTRGAPITTSTDNRPGPDNNLVINAFPNPSTAGFTLSYDLGANTSSRLEIYSLTGKLVESYSINAPQGRILFGHELPSGFYLASLSSGSRLLRTVKLVKQ